MKRNVVIAAAAIAAGVAVLLPQALQTPKALAELFPASPLLYLEAKNFAGLVSDWNASKVKAEWLASADYNVFSKSRLFLRLSDAQTEFAAAAGLSPDMTLVATAAGSNSALALYDIGSLEFLYITRMPQSKAFETMLWQSRAKFQPRKSAGLDYYVRRQQNRLAAFAVTNDLLLIATDEQALASALALIAGQPAPPMRQEQWYQRATAAQTNAGDVRLVMNFDRVARTPYFRSYWVQQNTRELMQFDAAIADLDRGPSEFRERRTLLRGEAGADLRPAEAVIGELVRYAPADAGLVRAWAKPANAMVLAMVQGLIVPQAKESQPLSVAPGIGNIDAVTGGEQDLEVHIDEPPVADASATIDWSALRTLIDTNGPGAVLQVETSQTGDFVRLPSAVAILGAKTWEAGAVQSALGDVAAHAWTVSGIGAGWVQRGPYQTLDGLGRLSFAISGRVLIVSSSETLLPAMLAQRGATVLPAAAYSARYLHVQELPKYARLTSMIDVASGRSDGGEAREPLFFSENIASLGRALGRVSAVSVESHDDGGTVSQTVLYRLQ